MVSCKLVRSQGLEMNRSVVDRSFHDQHLRFRCSRALGSSFESITEIFGLFPIRLHVLTVLLLLRQQLPHSRDVVICEHGTRRVTRMDTSGTKTVLATHTNGRRLNSPNDLALSRRGDLYFTDPPYGLPGFFDDPDYVGWSGVYRIRKEVLQAAGENDKVPPEPELLETGVKCPSGLGFSADSTKFYLANACVGELLWYVYDVTEDGGLSNRRIFRGIWPTEQATGCPSEEAPEEASYWGEENKGAFLVPDGLKVDHEGNLFATGRGGVMVFSPDGSHLGMIHAGNFVSNVVLGGDGYLYMATAENITRVKVTTRALQW